MKYSDFKKQKVEMLVDVNDLKECQEGRTTKVKDKRTFRDDEGIFHVTPIGWNDKQLFIVCPVCGEIHIHGMSEGSYSGFRVAHCINDSDDAGYYVEPIII